MKIKAEDFRRHYASLSDDALLALDTSDLVEVARQCYDEEVSRRGLGLEEDSAAPGSLDYGEGEDATYAASDFDSGDKPSWLEHAESACSFSALPGQNSEPQLDEARHLLETARIPCYVAVPSDQETGEPVARYDLMVPSQLYLEAVSLLDKEIFNADLEATWRAHFETLEDEELKGIKLKSLIAGLLDRVQRLTNVYNDEMARRRSRE